MLNEYFNNVCELDLVFNFYKVYTVVDEMFLAGEIRETSQNKVQVISDYSKIGAANRKRFSKNVM